MVKDYAGEPERQVIDPDLKERLRKKYRKRIRKSKQYEKIMKVLGKIVKFFLHIKKPIRSI